MTCSTLCSQPATMHCGELISMKDCGLWATMTYKLSSNFCLVLSAPLCLRRCRAPALTGALKCSPSDQQLRGVGRERERRRGRGGRKKKKKGGCFLGRECAFEFVLVCLYSAHVTAGKVKNQIDCYHPCPSLFCPSLVCLCSLRCVLLPGLVSIQCGPQPCGVSLPTNQTSQCHWAASSKTHGHVSSLHSTAFQRLAGSSTKEL